MRRGMTLAGGLGVLLTLGWIVMAAAPDSATDEVPAPLAPFSYLIGGWTGSGIPAANKLKGWQEKYMWAWKFSKGQPIGLTVEVTGGKVLSRAQLTFDPETEQYHLDGTDPEGKPVAFVGTLDAKGKFLTLERVTQEGSKVRERLKLWPNAQKIRLTLQDERKEPGSPQYAPYIESGLTKDGESLAGTAADTPKCIVTGGAATGSVSFEGKSFPICCSGCRDEFNDNPAKYVKKALLRAENAGKTTKATSTSLAKDDGAFEGLVDESKPRPKPAAMKTRSERPSTKKAAPPEVKPEPDADTEAPPPKPRAGKTAVDPSAKAASLLRQAKAMEKIGNTKAALGYYRKIVADYPDAPQVKDASARIKAIENP